MKELENKSESELEQLLENTAKVLNEKRETKRREAIAQIHQIATTAGVTVVIKEDRKTRSAPPVSTEKTYQHPDKPNMTWDGVGAMPKWLKELVAGGRDQAEFAVAQTTA